MKEILITTEEIKQTVKDLASRINRQYTIDEPLLVICILNGGFMYFSDLISELKCPVEVDFIKVKSYVQKFTQGDIKILKDVDTPVKGKRVLIVDDIYDSGKTIEAVVNYLSIKEPKSIDITTFLVREESEDLPYLEYLFYFNKKIRHAWFGRKIPKNIWAVGYGLDDQGYRRNERVIYNVTG